MVPDSATLPISAGRKLTPGQRIEAGHRLVEQEQARPLGQSRSQRDVGLPATGERADRFPARAPLTAI